ncbi:hypothetical protein MTR67_027997 [Solanum verrucosum]|uniref:Tf2-1-like SH3-like domain-containing protein n=1 Tax=Solanum verrucosum TaxID=315347 RepID=A0AAF0TVE0_SOLVR|nr:hypothetical protein MTR67_027997 [Solanum verrucosum]
MKGVMRFGKKGKLSPRHIGPYRIAKKIDNVAYELELPQELAAVHPVFHASMLKKCIGDPSLILPTESVRINDSLSYEEILVQILDRQVRRLRAKDVASVKVLWRNQFVEEATWEADEDMKKRYPYLFKSGGNVDQVFLILKSEIKGLRVKKKRRGEKGEEGASFRLRSSWISSGMIPFRYTQVPRASIRFAVDPVEYFRVSGEPLCIPEDSIILFSQVLFYEDVVGPVPTPLPVF